MKKVGLMTDMMTDTPPEHTFFYTCARWGCVVGAGVGKIGVVDRDLEKVWYSSENQPQPKRKGAR